MGAVEQCVVSPSRLRLRQPTPRPTLAPQRHRREGRCPSLQWRWQVAPSGSIAAATVAATAAAVAPSSTGTAAAGTTCASFRSCRRSITAPLSLALLQLEPLPQQFVLAILKPKPVLDQLVFVLKQVKPVAQSIHVAITIPVTIGVIQRNAVTVTVAILVLCKRRATNEHTCGQPKNEKRAWRHVVPTITVFKEICAVASLWDALARCMLARPESRRIDGASTSVGHAPADSLDLDQPMYRPQDGSRSPR